MVYQLEQALDAWEEEIKDYREDRGRLVNNYEGMLNRQYEDLRELHKKREMQWEDEMKKLQEEMERCPGETIVIVDSDEDNEDCSVPVSKSGKEQEALLAELARMKERNEMLELQIKKVPMEHVMEMTTASTYVTMTFL